MAHATKRPSSAERRSLAFHRDRQGMSARSILRAFRPVSGPAWLYSIDARFGCVGANGFGRDIRQVRAWLRSRIEENDRPDFVLVTRRPHGEIHARSELVLISGKPDAFALAIMAANGIAAVELEAA